MDITQEAIEYIESNTEALKEPVVAIFERTYRGWCGVQKVKTIAPVEKERVQNQSQFNIEKLDTLKVPIYVQKSIWDDVKSKFNIDLVGWSKFKRLALVQK